MKTVIPGVRFFRAAKPHSRQPWVYDSGIIVIGQGHKRIYLGEHQINYGPGDLVVLGVPLPLECEAYSDDGQPILGLTIDVSTTQLRSIIKQIAEHGAAEHISPAPDALALKSMSLSSPLEDAYLRLLKALQNDADAVFLGQDIVKEIIYWVLKGPMGHVLYERANVEGNFAKVAKVLDTLHSDYSSPLTVEDMAAEAHMSVPAFHRVFKQVTTESPLQYLKKVRLSKARDLIVLDGYRASDAALSVGYNSPSQFSREFKRHYHYSPKATFEQSA
jgi:AraC-like DNA-binding protein